MKLTTEKNIEEAKKDWNEYLDYIKSIRNSDRKREIYPYTFKELYGYEIKLCKDGGFILEGNPFAKYANTSEHICDCEMPDLLTWGMLTKGNVIRCHRCNGVLTIEKHGHLFNLNEETDMKNTKTKVYNLRKQFKKDVNRLLKKYQEHETLAKEFDIVNEGDRLTLMEEAEIIINMFKTYKSTQDIFSINQTEEIITDVAIKIAWGNADFGRENTTKREFIAQSLLKIACGYETGKTIREIMKNLGLVNVEETGVVGDITNLTLLGKEFLYRAYEKK